MDIPAACRRGGGLDRRRAEGSERLDVGERESAVAAWELHRGDFAAVAHAADGAAVDAEEPGGESGCDPHHCGVPTSICHIASMPTLV
jgi:hypothetical protein